jgi:hypothetical protein
MSAECFITSLQQSFLKSFLYDKDILIWFNTASLFRCQAPSAPTTNPNFTLCLKWSTKWLYLLTLRSSADLRASSPFSKGHTTSITVISLFSIITMSGLHSSFESGICWSTRTSPNRMALVRRPRIALCLSLSSKRLVGQWQRCGVRFLDRCCKLGR